MTSFLDSVFHDAENRYLKPEELKNLSQYVSSLPERLQIYRTLRDREIDILQWAADQLQAAMPQENPELLERSVKGAILMLRYCAMAMLMNDDRIVRERYVGWFSELSEVYGMKAIDATLYQYLNQRLNQILGSRAMTLLEPILSLAQGRELETASLNGKAYR
ncbi:hypothetical protein [Leptolyngbya ohadii]|uniref:hypothetical protein n=1 Tax=Leptolyngbya ohadii TaxID=1962290 RepID=UPI000B5A2160|nr:hypothetical protein [Leptolyngbya ohadii]